MRKLKLSQNRYALVDDEDYGRLSILKWQYHSAGYAVRGTNGQKMYLHRFLLQAPQGKDVDHINGNRLDNRKENLRICTRSQNQHNRNKTTNKTSSRFKGVNWVSKFKKWTAGVGLDNVHYRLGYFDSEIEAAKAYDVKAFALHGEFARLNFERN